MANFAGSLSRHSVSTFFFDQANHGRQVAFAKGLPFPIGLALSFELRVVSAGHVATPDNRLFESQPTGRSTVAIADSLAGNLEAVMVFPSLRTNR